MKQLTVDRQGVAPPPASKGHENLGSYGPQMNYGPHMTASLEDAVRETPPPPLILTVPGPPEHPRPHP